MEPSPNCTSVFVPGNTSKLIPGGSGVVAVVLRNLSGRDVHLEPHTEVGIVTTANIVPSIQIPNEPDMGEMRKYNVCLFKQICLKEPSQRGTESEDILQKIDLSGIDKWDPKMQQEAWDLILVYAFIFS